MLAHEKEARGHPGKSRELKIRTRALPAREGSVGAWVMRNPEANFLLTRVITPALPLVRLL